MFSSKYWNNYHYNTPFREYLSDESMYNSDDISLFLQLIFMYIKTIFDTEVWTCFFFFFLICLHSNFKVNFKIHFWKYLKFLKWSVFMVYFVSIPCVSSNRVLRPSSYLWGMLPVSLLFWWISNKMWSE